MQFMVAGTGISQLILILASPILTRLYDPQALGALGLFMSFVAIITICSGLRYELAIVLPNRDSEANEILQLTLFFNVLISIASIIIFLIYGMISAELELNNSLGWYIYLIPFSIFLSSAYQSLSFWMNRKNKFSIISLSKIIQSCVVVIFQILLGYILIGGFQGLIMGSLFGQFTAFLLFFLNLEKQTLKEIFIPKKSLFNVLKKYVRFPKFSMPGAVINTITTEFPVLIITYTFGLIVTGPFNLAVRVVGLPITVISGAVYQVLVSRVAELDRENFKLIEPLILKIFAILFVPAIIICFIFSGFLPDLFSFVFGNNWRFAGELASIMIFAYAFKFSISPLGVVLGLDRNVHLGFYWQALYFFSSIFTLTYFSYLDIENFILIFVLVEIVMYLIYFAFIFYGVRRPPQQEIILDELE
tara:strand:- start:116 stop:1369 length:1254 start_codon:yes stop_codon:yes gene_type:complete